MNRFPDNLGDFANLTFHEVFEKYPKWIELVVDRWTTSSGIFKKFHDYVLERMKDHASRLEHIERCREFVKGIEQIDCAEYLLKYYNE